MRVILTRHGETEENLQGILQGHLPGKLSKEGISQAKMLAKRLKDEKIDYIFSSDLARAADTTKEIIKYHPETPVEFTQELRERNLGELQGKTKTELGIEKTRMVASWLENKDGETPKQMYNRAKRLVNNLAKRFIGKNILLVGHNGINKAIIASLLGKPHTCIQDLESQGNTAVTIIKLEKEPVIEVFNCTKHLKK